MPFLEVRDVSKKFGEKTVLKNVSLTVNRGEVLAIAGPPGSGKTTLLKIVAGLISPTSGRIYLNGIDITDVPPHIRGFSMVFENPPVYPDRSGYENIAFPLKLKNMPEAEVRKRVYEIADLLGIRHVLDRKPSTFSGGEYQRVALARALVTNPAVLLLDEPLRNLDAKIREYMAVWLKQLQLKIGVTSIYSTHDPLEALTIGTRVAVILSGEIKQLGEPLTILNNPVNLDVDDYVSIPALNIFKGTAKAFRGKLVINIDKVSIEKNVSSELQFEERNVIAAIRPSDVSVVKTYQSGTLSGKVELIQYLGANALATIRLNDIAIRVIIPKTIQINEGDSIYIVLDPRNVRVYDVQSKQRIDL
ncbi:MAG: ABC transporter ATP-binding protein [Sulfolobales archaeon]|nr:ABC transporter ATP-binding protein [Sulfolobales archaeon]MCX8198840.1 ABC transporter ATP-binding protein [Sulfolobales archaeon]MDW8170762.1 ABC transporter ATP-binding protein [Desulfurococcaceae archaeon]